MPQNSGNSPAPLSTPLLVAASRIAFEEDQDFGGLTWPWASWARGSDKFLQNGGVIQNDRASRLVAPGPYDPGMFLGFLYFENDTGLFYQSVLVAGVPTWVYVAGMYSRTQAQLAALIATLTTPDVGMRIYVSDFHHVLWCTAATTVSYAPEDDLRAGEGPIFREVDPNPTTGWQLYDGSTISYLKKDGTTANVTLPDLTSAANKAAYAKAGSPNSAVNVAVAPTMTGAATDSAVTGVTNPANTGNGAGAGTGTNSTSVTVQAGAGTTVAANNHTHSESNHTHPIGAPTDPGHTHGLTGVSINADGEPQNLVRRPWFRR